MPRLVYKPVVLAILDGFGLSEEKKGNAIAQANKPNLSRISQSYPGTALHASGIEVGLPWGEVGNSEVGHLNIGAGFVMYQNLPRISLAIKDGTFFNIKAWKDAVDNARVRNGAVHIAGLLSSGGVHSHIDHAKALLEAIKKKGLKDKVYLHVFTDGQDVPPRTAKKFIKEIQEQTQKTGLGKIATVIGRRYAMDRDNNWHLTNEAFEAMTLGKGATAASAEKAVDQAYQRGLEDEEIQPTVINKNGLIKESDSLIFFNYRPDRIRQLTELFISKMPYLFLVTMTQYEPSYPVEIAFPPQKVSDPLGKVISYAGKTQLRVAESEKKAHVSYFLNGGIEEPFPGENRYFIPSPKVDSYVQAPQMSAYKLAQGVITAIDQGYDFIIVNFANADMLGHTGSIEAAKKGVEFLDDAVGKIINKTLSVGGAAVITADHGNAEEMINLETDQIDKEHSTNPVPIWIVTPENILPGKAIPDDYSIRPSGALIDVAPTVLSLGGLEAPKEMSGRDLSYLKSRQAI